MQTPTPDQLEVLTDMVISVGDHGLITDIVPSASHAAPVDVALGDGAVVLPGLVDTHIHAPQWPQLGTGLDLPLEEWLFAHTFPLERSLCDPDVAAEVWPHLVTNLLAHGTTTAVYYATIDVATTTMLAETCARLGQRAFVGRVAMDHPEGTPEGYRDGSADDGIAATRASIEAIDTIGSPLVSAIVTPRFIPACTDELLAGLGELAEASNTLVQTHCSESDWEHRYAIERFGVTDTDALARFGLVRRGTVLAHGDHVGDDDLAMIGERGAGIAHCPLSNAYFANAVFPARRALDAGVPVGLGSDIAGGAEPGLLAQCAHAVTASRYLDDGVDARLAPSQRGVGGARLDIVAAFHMATRGGADLLGIPVGYLEVGRAFDALVVDPSADSSLRRWDVDDDRRYFEKVARLARPSDIAQVWVAGRQVR